jgi:hypothetical protein
MKTILNWLYENWMKGTPFCKYYDLDVIISVGYRVHSKSGRSRIFERVGLNR